MKCFTYKLILAVSEDMTQNKCIYVSMLQEDVFIDDLIVVSFVKLVTQSSALTTCAAEGVKIRNAQRHSETK